MYTVQTDFLFCRTLWLLGWRIATQQERGGGEKSGATSVSCFFFLSPPSSSLSLPPKAQTVNRTPETPPLSFLFCLFPASLFGSSVSLFGVWEQRGCNGMRKRGGKEDLTAFFPDSATHKQKKASFAHRGREKKPNNNLGREGKRELHAARSPQKIFSPILLPSSFLPVRV